MKCLFIREKGNKSDFPNYVIFISSDICDIYRSGELPSSGINITEILFDQDISVEEAREDFKSRHGYKLDE